MMRQKMDRELMCVEKNFGKFLYRAFGLIDDYLKKVEDISNFIIPELFHELLKDITEKKIFDGENITFMVPEKKGDKEILVVAASTKETTDEGERLVGKPCGPVAFRQFFQGDIWNVKVIENHELNGNGDRRSYKGKSYLYPIIDLDSHDGRPQKYGLIGIANIPEEELPDSYVDLLKNMGKALGRQFGRVMDRQKAQVELRKLNKELTIKSKELKKALLNIENRCKQVELQTFLFNAINHDFKRALISITAQTDYLSKNVDEKAKKGLQRINSSICDALELVEIIDNLEKTNSQEIPVQRFLENYRQNGEYLALIQKRRNDNRVTWDLNANEMILFDPLQLQRIMNNLVSNAIKYSKKKGEIHIASAVVTEKNYRTVEIAVSDQGIGISKKDVKKNIFKSHWRSRVAKASTLDGTGMGLSFVKYIMDKCGGEIKVESQPGRINRGGDFFATTFILSFKGIASHQDKDKEKSIVKRRRALVIGEKNVDKNYLNEGLQHLIEDLEKGLGINAIKNIRNVEDSLGSLGKYAVVVCQGPLETNDLIIQEAKKTKTRVVCLETGGKKIHIISEEAKVYIPADSFLMFAPQFIN